MKAGDVVAALIYSTAEPSGRILLIKPVSGVSLSFWSFWAF